ncbi:MAG: electron transport complex subunit E [Lachnospiraceae bacterium]|nr:electron transport complex subunit E [Lachnospiraceae bacterium]
MNGEIKRGALGLRADSPVERFLNGLIAENPTLVLMLGMCPTLAVTTSATNGLTMGLATTVVLAMSNLMISLLRRVIPDTVRIPSFIVIIATFVTLVQLTLQAYLPSLNEALGVYIPLIVVNCIIFGRAEAYASKHGVIPAFFDGLGMGLGFTIAITVIGFFREFIGAGTVFGIQILGEQTIVPGPVGAVLGMYEPISIFIMQSGAFFVLAFLIASMNRIKRNQARKGRDVSKFRDTSDTDTLVKEADGTKEVQTAGGEA